MNLVNWKIMNKNFVVTTISTVGLLISLSACGPFQVIDKKSMEYTAAQEYAADFDSHGEGFGADATHLNLKKCDDFLEEAKSSYAYFTGDKLSREQINNFRAGCEDWIHEHYKSN